MFCKMCTTRRNLCLFGPRFNARHKNFSVTFFRLTRWTLNSTSDVNRINPLILQLARKRESLIIMVRFKGKKSGAKSADIKKLYEWMKSKVCQGDNFGFGLPFFPLISKLTLAASHKNSCVKKERFWLGSLVHFRHNHNITKGSYSKICMYTYGYKNEKKGKILFNVYLKISFKGAFRLPYKTMWYHASDKIWQAKTARIRHIC